MKRRLGMVAKALLPGVGLLMLAILAILAQAIAGRLGTSPLLTGIYSAAGWISPGAFFIGIAMLGQASYRLWRWSNGFGPECSECGGMLGRKRSGRHAPYRRCLGCARTNSRKTHVYARTDVQAS